MDSPRVIAVREQPAYLEEAITYIQGCWPEVAPMVYRDCLTHTLDAVTPLPQWYLRRLGGRTIGCSGLVTNDFISRMDLYPWICAVYVAREHRGHAYGGLLLERSREDCARHGFANVYLATEHVGYYERFGFTYLAPGYGPDGAEMRIYGRKTAKT